MADKAETKTQYEQAKKKSKKNPANLDSNFKGTKTEIGKIIENSACFLNVPKAKTDEEVAERLNSFFMKCSEGNIFPTVEKMALCLGITRQTLHNWETGNDAEFSSPARREMIAKAKEILASIDAELVLRRKIPEVSYIFRAKNFHGMHDKQEHVITAPNNPLGDIKSESELIERYQEALPEIIDS